MDQPIGSKTEAEAIRIFTELYAYEEALEREQRQWLHSQHQLGITRGFLTRIGLKVEDLDRLNIIHVTGTKGKGSTCAFTEQILRSHGYSTGFFSSPHLVQFRERIRINGQPIGEELFVKYFWDVYERLEETKDAHEGMTLTHFRLSTTLAFYIYLKEKVDLVILEVGIGGAYDCTNIIRKPWVCGITTLEIDHVDILGDTIEKIAWHKTGIFKPGVPAFTVKQSEDAMSVIKGRAKEIGCPVGVCPQLEEYQAVSGPLQLSLKGHHQRSNAALALQLSHMWLQKKQGTGGNCVESVNNTHLFQAPSFEPSPITVKALAETVWPGRTQTVKNGAVTYFLDGAHTNLSMQACADWFMEVGPEHERNTSGPVVRVLLFNTTGERDTAALLKPMVPCYFDFAVFCPNIIKPSSNADQQDLTVLNKCMTHCVNNVKRWHLHNNVVENKCQHVHNEDNPPLKPEKNAEALAFSCILSALQWITQGRDPVVADLAGLVAPAEPSIEAKGAPLREAAQIQVLVTGSLYLVGGVLNVLQVPPSKWKL